MDGNTALGIFLWFMLPVQICFALYYFSRPFVYLNIRRRLSTENAARAAEHQLLQRRQLIDVVEAWRPPPSMQGRYQNEIWNHLQVRSTADGTYMAEQLRANPRAMVRNPSDEIPFIDQAREFSSVEEAVNWLRKSEVYADGVMQERFEQELARSQLLFLPRRAAT